MGDVGRLGCTARRAAREACSRPRLDHPALPTHPPARRLCAKEAALRGYDGPSLFAVPGNHDWIDGLDCFQVGGRVGLEGSGIGGVQAEVEAVEG